jgi:hypothetical protein
MYAWHAVHLASALSWSPRSSGSSGTLRQRTGVGMFWQRCRRSEVVDDYLFLSTGYLCLVLATLIDLC